jgi:hypothetical protein
MEKTSPRKDTAHIKTDHPLGILTSDDGDTAFSGNPSKMRTKIMIYQIIPLSRIVYLLCIYLSPPTPPFLCLNLQLMTVS